MTGSSCGAYDSATARADVAVHITLMLLAIRLSCCLRSFASQTAKCRFCASSAGVASSVPRVIIAAPVRNACVSWTISRASVRDGADDGNLAESFRSLSIVSTYLFVSLSNSPTIRSVSSGGASGLGEVRRPERFFSLASARRRSTSADPSTANAAAPALVSTSLRLRPSANRTPAMLTFYHATPSRQPARSAIKLNCRPTSSPR